MDSCDGSIDFINGSPIGPATKVTALLSIGGWMTIAGKEGVTPDNVFAVLTAEDGRTLYVKSERVARSDVIAYFGRTHMQSSGLRGALEFSELPDCMTQLCPRSSGQSSLR